MASEIKPGVEEVVKKYPLSKDLVFGPTRQGEGPQAGLHTYFVRFAGCEYECSWCDTLYAVGPKHPGWVRLMHTSKQIANLLGLKGAMPGDWITLSGGNPAQFVDDEFVDYMAVKQQFLLAMETQGSQELSPYVNQCISCLVVSPKPPSSGMDKKFDPLLVSEMLRYRTSEQTTALKFVVFDKEDLDWAHYAYTIIKAASSYSLYNVQLFITPGTPMKMKMPDTVYYEGSWETHELAVERRNICESMLSVWEMANSDARFNAFRIIPQLHALAYGQKAGV